MSKPSTLPTWNTSGVNRVEPSGGFKASGWPASTAAVSSYFNFWMNQVYKWIAYFDELNLDADTKTIFPEPSANVGGNWQVTGTPTSSAAALTVALESTAAGNADFCLSDHMRDGQQLKDVRVWLHGNDTVDVTATVYAHDFDAGTSTSAGTTTESNVSSGAVTFLDVNSVDLVAGQLTNRIWLRLAASAAGARALAIVLEFEPIP